MSIATEFREFAVKGNVVDLAVGVIIGAAFAKIVDSLVGDIIMPIVGRIFGGFDFSNYFIPLAGQSADDAGGGEEGRRRAGLRQLPHRDGQLRDPRLHHLHDGARDQPPAQGRPPAPAAPAEEVVLLRQIRDAVQAQPALAERTTGLR